VLYLVFFVSSSITSSSSCLNVWPKVLCSILLVFVVALLLLRGFACVFAWRKSHLRAERGYHSDDVVSLIGCENQDAWHFMYQMRLGATASDFPRRSLKTLSSYALCSQLQCKPGYQIGLDQTTHQSVGSSVAQFRMAIFGRWSCSPFFGCRP